MPQPNITVITINDDINDLLTAIEALINQSVKSVSMIGSQTLRIVTQDGTNNECFITKAKDGILSGMGLIWTGALAADIAAGNYQSEGATNSFGVVTSISFDARHATLPRIDLVFADLGIPPSTQVIDTVTGTPSDNPVPPTIPGGTTPLYLVWIDPATVAAPSDFVIGTFQVDQQFPLDGAQVHDHGVIKSKLPTAPKMADFTPATPNWDADILFVDTSAGAVTMDLPDPTAYAGYERQWTIIDTGNATANNITLDATASGAFTINGAANDTIALDYRQYKLIARGGEFYGQ